MESATLSSPETKPRSSLGRFARNSAANASGMIVTSAIAFLLPAYLVHHLSVELYGAWVLILNLSAYVGYLDFGVQTAVAKYIAEYEARGDSVGCAECTGAGIAILSAASALGILLTGVMAWSVPRLFSRMPNTLYHDVRVSILFVGLSLSISLAASIFPAIFLGMQRYQIPTVINIVSRTLYATVLCLAVLRHSSLAVMGAAVAAVNLMTALLHLIAWNRLASHVRVSFRTISQAKLRQMLEYCIVLSLWSVCMLMISGLDLTIVGHYAFRQVAFYSIATSPTNFMLVITGALLAPLLPATSALSTARNAEQMGGILLRSTRYATILMLLGGLPLLVGGFLILRVWVGANYAVQSVQLLRALLLANIVRQLCGPYATMVVATARQRVATAAAVTEGAVNLIASILLARHFGAWGVAAGTLIGSFASVAMHFGVSMHFTRNLDISRAQLFFNGIARPLVMVIPAALLLPYWWLVGPPAMRPMTWIILVATTGLLVWFAAITSADRDFIRVKLMRKT